VEDSTDTLKELFDDMTRTDPAGATVTFKTMEYAMFKRKEKTQPKIPTSAEEFPTLLTQTTMAANYRTSIRVGHEYVGSIFYSPQLVETIVNVADIAYDGTFDTVPLLFYQLFTIFGIFGKHSIPPIFCLMSNKTEAAYLALLDKLTELLPQFNPATAMGDYEIASRNALLEVFPEIEQRGCFFHFSQAVLTNIKKHGLITPFQTNHSFNRWARAVMSLPLLPSENIIPCYNILDQQSVLNLDALDTAKLQNFKSYVRTQWLVNFNPTDIAVHDFEAATNNGAESWHSKLKSRMKVSHPNIWKFVRVLNNMIADSQNDIARLNNGLELTRPRKLETVKILRRRNCCKERLTNGTYTPLQFLFAVSFTVYIPRNLRGARNLRGPQHLRGPQAPAVPVQAPGPAEPEQDPNFINPVLAEMDPEPIDIDAVAVDAPVAAADNLTYCPICLEGRPDTYAFDPCGHVACGRCSNMLVLGINRRCHLCNLPFLRRIRVYLT
jgi:hypothetical protein